jgi:hypothetical protein
MINQLDHLPVEVTLTVANYLPFKTYIQYSQSCKSIQNVLVSTHVIRYLNTRFKFGQDNTTGALLLFVFHNILFIPENIRMVILRHFICSIKTDAMFIRAWSLLHAIHCSNPGKFINLLANENGESVRDFSLEETTFQKRRREAWRKNLQSNFAREINDNIISMSIAHKHELRCSKTYQTVFKNFILTGDMRTVENCLRSLGPPTNSIIELAETDYDGRSSSAWLNFSSVLVTDEDHSVETICRQNRYLHYNEHQLRALKQELLEKYQVKVSIIPSPHSRSYRPFNGDTFYCRKKRRNRRHF